KNGLKKIRIGTREWNGKKLKTGLKTSLKNFGPLTRWIQPVASPMLWIGMKKPVNIYLWIVPLKVRREEGAFVMTGKVWNQERSISQRTALLIWPPKWELNF